jgi:hypothetical protein
VAAVGDARKNASVSLRVDLTPFRIHASGSAVVGERIRVGLIADLVRSDVEPSTSVNK